MQSGWQNYNTLSTYTQCYSEALDGGKRAFVAVGTDVPLHPPLVRLDVVPRDEGNITFSRGPRAGNDWAEDFLGIV